MKISFAICTHNEGDYIKQLFKRLTEFIQLDHASGVQYEIVVVDDFSNDEYTLHILQEYYQLNQINLFYHSLIQNGKPNFAEHKNFMNSKCTGDWILNLDADEWVTDDFLGFIPLLIDANPNTEAYYIPRVNTVDGLTLKHLQQWHWMIFKLDGFRKIKVMDVASDEYKLLKQFDHIISEENGVVVYDEPIVAWPDYQMRLYKNDNRIKWNKPVHEQLSGYTHFSMLPQDPSLAIRHYKDINRQELQNRFYDSI